MAAATGVVPTNGAYFTLLAEQGAQGAAGTDGTNGTDGAAGATGQQGIQGTQGLQGMQGIQGATGAQGPSGTGGAADIAYVIDGGGAAIVAGLKGYVFIDFPCTINQWTLIADRTGSAVVDIWECTYAAFDAGATHPGTADKITASAPPTISSGVKGQDANVATEGWTVSIPAGSVLAFNVTSASTVQRLILSLKVTKTS